MKSSFKTLRPLNVKDPLELFVFDRGPPSLSIEFRGPRERKIWLTNIHFSYKIVLFCEFSKIVDIQAHSTVLSAALWACISAMFSIVQIWCDTTDCSRSKWIHYEYNRWLNVANIKQIKSYLIYIQYMGPNMIESLSLLFSLKFFHVIWKQGITAKNRHVGCRVWHTKCHKTFISTLFHITKHASHYFFMS